MRSPPKHHDPWDDVPWLCPADYVVKSDYAAFYTCSRATDIVEECCVSKAQAAAGAGLWMPPHLALLGSSAGIAQRTQSRYNLSAQSSLKG